MDDARHLVRFDTDRIKDYVFATDRLREVRGASALLTWLNEKESPKLVRRVCPGAETLFFGGGGGAVTVPSQGDAEAVIRAVEDLYRRKTVTASITGASVPLGPDDFSRYMELASVKLRQLKDERAQRTVAAMEPYTQPCASCEQFPAVKVSPIDAQPVCESCDLKRDEFRKHREKAPDTPESLQELGELSRPPGYVGFIYADGNSISEVLSQLRNPEDYRHFANGLNDLIKRVVDETLDEHPRRRARSGDRRPHECLLIGGDDLMLVTAGDIALPVALKIATDFEAGAPAVLEKAHLPHGKPLTLGVGVVLAHAGFPIAAFRQLAVQLVRNAKRRCAIDGYALSAIDFMVVSASASSDVDTLRREALSEHAFVFRQAERRVHLTQRPYLLEDALKLLEHARSFKGFPRSQLHYLYEGLFHSRAEARFRWRQVAARLAKRDPAHRRAMDAFDAEFGDGGNGLSPWRKRPDWYTGELEDSCAFGDLVEIHQFIPG